MNVDWRSEVEGIPLRKIRDLLKRVHRGFRRPFVAEQLGIPESHARRVLALCRDNLVEREHGHGQGDWFIPTVSGNALAMAMIRKRITRATAENIVEQLLSRISTINHDPYFLYIIAEASVFGSYIGDAPSLGDVNILIKLEVRAPWTTEQACEESAKRAAARSKRGIVSSLWYGRNEIIKELKATSRYLSLHEESDVSGLGVKLAPLYQRDR